MARLIYAAGVRLPSERAVHTFTITACRACQSYELLPVLSLGTQYLTDYLKPSEPDETPRAPLQLVRCRACGLVQLHQQVPPDQLYGKHYWYRSAMNQTMRGVLRAVARQVAERAHLDHGSTVLDIGANDGTLLSYLPDVACRLAVEPAPNLVRLVKEHADLVVPAYFGDLPQLTPYQGAVDAITAVAMFYDVPDPVRFCRAAADLLRPGGCFVIQMNDVYALLHDASFDIISHEHLCYYTVASLGTVLTQVGLEIFALERLDVNGGTARYWIGYQGDHPVEDTVFEQAAREQILDTPEYWRVFEDRVKGIAEELKRRVEAEVEQGGTVYVYGASTRGNTILQTAGLDHRLLAGAAEIHEEKIGLVTGGTRIPIVSEAEARAKATMFLILPYSYLGEFVVREDAFLRAGGKLLVPLPSVEVITR